MVFIWIDALLVRTPSATGREFVVSLVLESKFVAGSELALGVDSSLLATHFLRSSVICVPFACVLLSQASFSAIFGLIFVVIDLQVMIRLTSPVAGIWSIVILPVHGGLKLASQLISGASVGATLVIFLCSPVFIVAVIVVESRGLVELLVEGPSPLLVLIFSTLLLHLQ